MICLSRLSGLFSVPAPHFLHWLENFHPTHDCYVLLKLLFNWRLSVQEAGLSQQLQVGPENQDSLQGKHNTDSQSQIQNSAPLPMFSPAKLICLEHNCKLIKGFLLQVIWYDRDEQWEDHPEDVTPVPEKNQKQVCFTFWTQNSLSLLPTCFHINHN